LLPGARGALVLGSGGQGFFEGFRRSAQAGDGQPNPLDRYTRAVIEDAARAALEPAGVAHVELFPFLGGAAGPVRGHVPFQRLGRAAGLGGPSPLGLQVHPVFGPWWAYRGLVVVAAQLPAAPTLSDACAGCPAPCVAACPAGAVRREGFDVPACHARRLTVEACRLSCDARIACVRGPEHRYTPEQLAFHMRASMPRRSG
jgi:hypothetical protein